MGLSKKRKQRLLKTFTDFWVLHLENDASHGENYSQQEAQFNADQGCGRHADQPHDGVDPTGPPLCRNVSKLPQRPSKTDDDDTGQNTLLEIIEERRKEEEDEEDNQGADQTRHLRRERRFWLATQGGKTL